MKAKRYITAKEKSGFSKIQALWLHIKGEARGWENHYLSGYTKLSSTS
jgi:hypothetical protein